MESKDTGDHGTAPSCAIEPLNTPAGGSNVVGRAANVNLWKKMETDCP